MSDKDSGNHQKTYKVNRNEILRRLHAKKSTIDQMFADAGISATEAMQVMIGIPVYLDCLTKISTYLGISVDTLIDPLPEGEKPFGGFGAVYFEHDDDADITLKIGSPLKDTSIHDFTNKYYQKLGHGGPVSEESEITKQPAAVGEDYASLKARLDAENAAFRGKLAAELAPALNARIQEMPHETYEQKKALANWVNEQLDSLGLAVKCPKTQLPARLHGDTGSWPEIGRFQFQVATGKGRPTRTVSTDKLPVIELVDASSSKELQGDWRQTVGPKESRSGRLRS